MTQNDTPMPPAPLTPSDDDTSDLTSPSIDYSPATVPYNEAFENDLMNAILHPPSNPAPRIHPTETPMLAASQLPISLSSPLRTYPSPIPGLYTTHANGYHTGGPGPSPARVREFSEQFVREHEIKGQEHLERVVAGLVEEKIGDVRRRMEDRERAVERNREVERELEGLRLQREAERRVLERAKGKR